MKKASTWSLCLAIVIGCLAFGLEQAQAIPPFKKEFDAKYVKKDGSDTEKAFAALVDKAKCNVCHVKGEKKTERNAYGDALAELLDKKEDEKNVEKIKEALDKVSKMNSKKDDPKSPTFGDIIMQGKLPGGNEE